VDVAIVPGIKSKWMYVMLVYDLRKASSEKR